MLEGSVHFLAALRMMAREAGFGEAVRVSAVTRSMAPQKLPAPDSMSGTVYFESGAGASFSMTMAAGQLRVALSATGTNVRVCLAPDAGGAPCAPAPARR